MKQLFGKIAFRLARLFKKELPIPAIAEKRKILEHYAASFNPATFVETGTFLGDTVAYFSGKFPEIISIELSEDLAKKAAQRFSANANVRIIQGDSSRVLIPIIQELKSPAMFWLDGHYSSEFFVQEEFIRTAKGDTNTPVMKELDIILSATFAHIVLIDDARLFNGKDDYPSIAEISKKVAASGKYRPVFVEHDIIHIIPVK